MSGGLTRFLGTQDMTVGSPIKKLIQFSIPLLLGNLAQQMYNTVDSIVVGRYVGDNALAAVGASGPMLNLLLVLFIGISTGANVMVAQYFGAKQREQLSKAVGTTITLTFLASLVIMVVGPLLVPPFLELVGTPPEIFEWTADYLTIVFWGIAGMAYYNILAGVLRGMGDSVMPLVFLLVACGLNIVLDLLFVTQFHWDVAGVAWATIIAQFISAILCLWRLMRMKDTLDINWNTLRPKSHMVKELLVLGLPSGVSQAIFSTAAIVVQSLTNSFGTVIIAVNTVVMRVDGFAMMPNFTFGNAMTTYTGQNMGAGRVDRVEEGVREGMRLGLVVIAVLVAASLLFGGQLVGLFTSTPEVIELGQHMMRILAVGYLAMAVTQTLSGVMRGAGDTMTPMWISMITTVVIRVPIAYGLAALTKSPDSLFISLLISWCMGALLSFAAYKRGKWRKKAIVKRKDAPVLPGE